MGASRPQDLKPSRLLLCGGAIITIGGLERMILEVLQLVRDRGGAVHCIVNSWGPEALRQEAERIGASWSTGYYHNRLEKQPSNPGLYLVFVWDILRTSGGLLRDVLRFRPTHILLTDIVTVARNWPALALLRLTNVRVLVAVQNAPAMTPFWGRLWRAGAPVVDAFVCSSQECDRRLTEHGIAPLKRRVVHNTAPARQPARPGIAREPMKIAFVGQVIPEKGLDLLLDAVGLLVARGLNPTLDVVGRIDGWVSPSYTGYREALLERAESPDLKGRINFLGWRDDVPDCLRRATVHCCPSRPEMCEGLPLVVLEAKAAGTPSVAFNHGSFPEIIEHARTGWLCPEMTPESLADGLAHVLSADAHEMASADDIIASGRPFSRDSFRAGWWSVLEDVTAEPIQHTPTERPARAELR